MRRAGLVLILVVAGVAGCISPDGVPDRAEPAFADRPLLEPTAAIRPDGASESFASAVDLHGDVLAAADRVQPSEDSQAVRVHLFEGPEWTESSRFDIVHGRQAYASDLVLDGDRIVVGVPARVATDLDPGNAYVYRRIADQWVQESRLRPRDGESLGLFGSAVALEGDRLVVADSSYDELAENAGAAFAYRWNGAAWVRQERIDPPTPNADLHFGRRVELVDGRLAVSTTESVHVYGPESEGWSLAETFGSSGDVAKEPVERSDLARDGLAVEVPYSGSIGRTVQLYAEADGTWTRVSAVDVTRPESWTTLEILWAYDSGNLVGRLQEGFADHHDRAVLLYARNGSSFEVTHRLATSGLGAIRVDEGRAVLTRYLSARDDAAPELQVFDLPSGAR